MNRGVIQLTRVVISRVLTVTLTRHTVIRVVISRTLTVTLSKANKPLLYTQRLKQILTVFKAKTVNHNLRNKFPLDQPKFNTIKYGKYGEGARLWNSIENNIKESQTLNIFKEAIKKWPGISYNCSICSTCGLSYR